MPVPGEGDVPVVVTTELELTLGELTHVWTLGVGSDSSLGRPKEWNGESSGFDNFAFKFSNWFSGLPGDAERFLEDLHTWVNTSCGKRWRHEKRSKPEASQPLCELRWAAKL